MSEEGQASRFRAENNSGWQVSGRLTTVEDMDRLEVMLNEQRELSKRIKEEHEYHIHDTADWWMERLCTAMSNEIEELRDQSGWKWWSKNEEFDKEAAKKETIDILHFLLQTFNELDMDAQEIYEAYFNKNKINHNRQDRNY